MPGLVKSGELERAFQSRVQFGSPLSVWKPNFIEGIMTIIVKSEITITKGFEIWKTMVKANSEKMKIIGFSFLFAGTSQDDPTKLVAILRFDSIEALESFGADQELTEQRREAGAVIESGVMTIMSDDFFTNYPEPFIQD